MEKAPSQTAPKPWLSAEELEALPTWTCDLAKPKAEEDLTVGQIFVLSCAGPSAPENSGTLSFAPIDPAQNYAVRILKINELKENSLQAEATSYLVGDHQLTNVPVKTAQGPLFKVEALNFKVKTVITEQEPQPYGPIPPFTLNYPYWLGVVLLAIVVVSFVAFIFRWRRRRQMAKVIEELKQHNTALGAYNQFNKDVRKLGRDYIFGQQKEWSDEKKNTYIEKLDSIFRMYLLREFFVPALDWSSQLVLKTVAKQDKKRFPVYGLDLEKILFELDRAKTASDKIKTQDCQQLTFMANRVSQIVWNSRRKNP